MHVIWGGSYHESFGIMVWPPPFSYFLEPDDYSGRIFFAVDGFDRGFDRDNGSERDRTTEAEALGDSTVRGGEPRIAVETRTRGEAYADLQQIDESGWHRGRRYEAPHGELAKFRAERAGLPEVSSGEAGRYVEQHRAGRPWLVAAERASPEAARIIVAADQSGGHGHIRREGWVTEEANMRRVAYLEDPALLDPDKRRRGIDGLKADGHAHHCGTISTRFTNPDAFATALARGAGPMIKPDGSRSREHGSPAWPAATPLADTHPVVKSGTRMLVPTIAHITPTCQSRGPRGLLTTVGIYLGTDTERPVRVIHFRWASGARPHCQTARVEGSPADGRALAGRYSEGKKQ